MKKKAVPEKTSSAPEAKVPPLPRKLGANHSETAKYPKRHDNNFKQSRDIREDRGIRQMKNSPRGR